MKIIKETSNFFKQQDKQKVLNYLSERNVKSDFFMDFFNSSDFGLLDNVFFVSEDEEYAVSHFLGSSETQMYDIWSVNKNLRFENTNKVAFAILVGDDAVFIDTKTGAVFLYLIQSDRGSIVKVSDTLDEFIKLLK